MSVQLQATDRVTLALTGEQIQIVLTALDELPRKHSQRVFDVIYQQLVAASAPPAANDPAPPAPEAA